MNRLSAAATRLTNAVFALVAAVLTVAMAIFLLIAGFTWLFTDGSPATNVGRAVGCLVFALGFKFLSIAGQFEFAPTRRATTRRPTRKA